MQNSQRAKILCDLFGQWIRNSFSKIPVNDQASVQKFTFESYRHKISWQFQQFQVKLGKKLDVFGNLVGKQCNAIAAQRLRRTAQIYNLYSKIYNEQSLKTVIDSLKRSVLKRHKVRAKPLLVLLGISVFSWDRDCITDNELYSYIEDAEIVQHVMKSCGKLAAANKTSSNSVKQTSNCNAMQSPRNKTNTSHSGNFMDKWENVIDRSHLQVWRRPLDKAHLYEYKVCGTYYDIPARSFYNAQVNLDYRKEWDRLVIQLDVVDRDETTGSDVIHWVSHFPYPMYSRDYVYIRRSQWNDAHKVMVISSRAVDHPVCPKVDNYVRVTQYTSNMVIKPHSSFDENGFDYVLTYHDDPQANFPTFAYKWMASTGLPDFVDKLHRAAKTLNDRSKHWRTSNDHITRSSKPTPEKRTHISHYS